MLNRLKLGTKFTLILLLIFVTGNAIAGIFLFNSFQQWAQAQIATRGLVMMETINSARDYTSTHTAPLLAANLKPDEFIPEIVPSFAARCVFETLRTNPDYKDLLYKEAALNPTNLRDKADLFEAALTKQFEQDNTISQMAGFRDFGRQQYFYSARPLTVSNTSCLQCHSVPSTAPKAMVDRYGRENGFGWQLNSVIGAQVVYVPSEKVFRNAHRGFTAVMAIILVALALAILILNQLLKPMVLLPVRHLAKLSQKLEAGTDPHANGKHFDEIETTALAKVAARQDELGQLAKTFQRMAREVINREQQLRSQIHELNIEIDESKRSREVSEIIGSDYFQHLQRRAKGLRAKKQDDTV